MNTNRRVNPLVVAEGGWQRLAHESRTGEELDRSRNKVNSQ